MYSKPVTLKQFKNVVVTFSLRWRLERNQATNLLRDVPHIRDQEK